MIHYLHIIAVALINMFKANFIGQEGLYKHKEYEIRIGVINGWIHVRRKCGAGRINYPSILEFIKDWDNIRKINL